MNLVSNIILLILSSLCNMALTSRSTEVAILSELPKIYVKDSYPSIPFDGLHLKNKNASYISFRYFIVVFTVAGIHRVYNIPITLKY